MTARNILVTGGSAGIGRACVEWFAARGTTSGSPTAPAGSGRRPWCPATATDERRAAGGSTASRVRPSNSAPWSARWTCSRPRSRRGQRPRTGGGGLLVTTTQEPAVSADACAGKAPVASLWNGFLTVLARGCFDVATCRKQFTATRRLPTILHIGPWESRRKACSAMTRYGHCGAHATPSSSNAG